MNIHVSLVYNAVSMGECFLTSWRNVVPSSSRVKSAMKNVPWHVKMKALHVFKMVGSSHPVTRCHVSENPKAQTQYCIKPQISQEELTLKASDESILRWACQCFWYCHCRFITLQFFKNWVFMWRRIFIWWAH